MHLLENILLAAEQQPSAIALCENQRTIRYQQLLLKSGAIAQALRDKGVAAGSRIAIALNRGIEASCAILGILAANCCYVPLDTNSPAHRRCFILEDAAVAAVIGSGASPEECNAERWIDIQQCSETRLSLSANDPEQLAAILYTSGSTGTPKGVALSHRAILAFTRWAANLVQLNQQDRIASLAPFYFDLSTFDLFASLAAGATVDFVPAQFAMSPSRLSTWLLEQRITGFYTVPSVLGFLALKGNLANTPLPDLRFLLFAGEVFATPLLRQLVALLPHVQYYNFYGPTETNVCAYWPVDAQQLRENQPIPIGLAAAGNHHQISADNHELLVKGPTLMSGYWQNGQLNSIDPQQWYATGDKVSLNSQQQLCYHGRLDRMLKCSGYRVEPAEIESAIRAINGVADCAVVGLHDETAGQRPAAAIVPEVNIEINEIRKQLQQQLPSYMHPARWQQLAELPRLDNGKLDYLQIEQLFLAQH